MTEEEYFIKNFPDSCYYDKPLSPYWDYFQYGVEFGERESEEKIEELERKLEQTEKDIADYQFNYPTIKELEKENAELRAIAENQQSSNMERYFKNKDLEKENAELREKLEIEQIARGDWFGKAVTKDSQLTKAKEIIKELMSFSVQLCDCRHTVDFEKTREEAEQFLSEVE